MWKGPMALPRELTTMQALGGTRCARIRHAALGLTRLGMKQLHLSSSPTRFRTPSPCSLDAQVVYLKNLLWGEEKMAHRWLASWFGPRQLQRWRCWELVWAGCLLWQLHCSCFARVKPFLSGRKDNSFPDLPAHKCPIKGSILKRGSFSESSFCPLFFFICTIIQYSCNSTMSPVLSLPFNIGWLSKMCQWAF